MRSAFSDRSNKQVNQMKAHKMKVEFSLIDSELIDSNHGNLCVKLKKKMKDTWNHIKTFSKGYFMRFAYDLIF